MHVALGNALERVGFDRRCLESGLSGLDALYYYRELMAALRGAIEARKLADFIATFEAEQAAGDQEPI